MLTSRSSILTVTTFFTFLGAAPIARAQTPPAPWSGVIASESAPPGAPSSGRNRTWRDAISRDGRYVVYKTVATWDDSAPGDIYLHDRYTGSTQKLNVAADGSTTNAPSDLASISGNGKHVIFSSSARLTLDDTNNVFDLYARDLEHNTITRISTGPQGEEPYEDVWSGSISNDGRFIAFTARFGAPANGSLRYAWLRDRDPDQNGVFDEPGTTATTVVSLAADGTPVAFSYLGAINGSNARYVAFTSLAGGVVPGEPLQVPGLYVRDRQTSTTFRVDTPRAGMPYGYAEWMDFSDDGSRLVYGTDAALVEDDPDGEDVYIFDLLTGGNTLVRLGGEPTAGHRVMLPAISGDGRYVAVTADIPDGFGGLYPSIYDIATGQATRILADTGARALEMSLTGDGSELLFADSPSFFCCGLSGTQVFVATPFDMTPSTLTVKGAGGTYTVQVSVLPDLLWHVSQSNPELITIQPDSGNGPGTFTFTISPNNTPYTQYPVIWIGSRMIWITQPRAAFISGGSPFDGPVAGGTLVSIFGGGFEQGATVTFDGIAATSVTFISSELIEAVTPAHPTSAYVEVRVTNPGGDSAVTSGFYYRDTTAPAIEYQLEGTAGSNGYYRSDVTIRWTVTDPESPATLQGCVTRTFSEDGTFYQYCRAESDGGVTERWVPVPRDTAAPSIQVWTPWYPPAQIVSRYPRGTAVTASYACTDAVSGVATCTGDVPDAQPLNTSVAGTFTFTVRAQDQAGNQSTTAIPYVIVAPTLLTLDTAAGGYGGSTALVARLATDGSALQGRTVTFSIGPVIAGSAVTNATGVATLPLALGTRSAGLYPTNAHFEESDIYATSDASSTLTVDKANAVITWNTPGDIVYLTALSGSQLNAVADIPGTFTYTPALGTVLAAGSHPLTATFTPADSTNYAAATAATTIQVTTAPVTLTWATPGGITYGTPLSSSQLNASTSVPGTFSYTPAAGALLSAGSHLLQVTFTPNDASYQNATAAVTLVVAPSSPVVTWATPSSISYGTALGSAQLNASASVAGTFVYMPAPGTVLAAGSHPLTATFTPADSTNYAAATAATTLQVTTAPVTLTWTAPAGITYGTALGSAQLNASASVPGSFNYTPAAGTVLSAGSQLLQVTFVPNDSSYENASAAVTLVVGPSSPVVTWAVPAPISYGTVLSGAQLNASASVAGTFVYTPSAGAALSAGNQTLSVTFIPADSVNYTSASRAVGLTVNPAPLTIRANDAAKVYGAPLPTFSLTATNFVYGETLSSLGGTLAFSTPASTTSAPGTYAVTPGGLVSSNYAIVFQPGPLTITKASTTLTLTSSPNPSTNNKPVQLRATVAVVSPGSGTPSGSVAFRENGVLLGTAPIVNGIASLTVNFRRGTHPLTATWAGDSNLLASSGSVSHQVN